MKIHGGENIKDNKNGNKRSLAALPCDISCRHSCKSSPFFPHAQMGVYPKNTGVSPQIIHLFIGFSIIFTIHFGRKSPYFWKHPPSDMESVDQSRSTRSCFSTVDHLARANHRMRSDDRLQWKVPLILQPGGT